MCCSIFWQFMGGRTKLAEHFGPDLFVFLIQELILFFFTNDTYIYENVQVCQIDITQFLDQEVT